MKRPLVWFMVSYVLGVVSHACDRFLLFLIAILIYVLLYLILLIPKGRKIKDRYVSVVLLAFPVIFLFGNYRMNQQLSPKPIESVVQEKIAAKVIGVVEEMQSYEESSSVTLSHVLVQPEGEEKAVKVRKIIVYLDELGSIQHGNELYLKGKLYPLTKASNPGQFDQHFYYKAKDICVKFYAEQVQVIDDSIDLLPHTLYLVKERLKSTYLRLLPEKEAGVLNAMLLGDKSNLFEDTKELYQKNGISHILAISGLHMSFFGLSIYKLLRKARCSLIPATILSVILILLYGILTNNSVSTKRAICMLTLLMLSTILGKTYDLLSALSFSAILVLIEAPMQLYQAGFLLSYGAILGIAVIYPVLERLFNFEHTLIQKLWDGFLVSLSVQAITLPILVYSYYEVSTYSVFLNLLILPLLSVLFPMAVLSGITALFNYRIGVICSGVVYFILRIYEALCRFMERIPGNLLLFGQTERFQILLFYLLVIIALLLIKREWNKWGILVLLICPILLVRKEEGVKLSFLDVGQGECMVLKNTNGNTYMIDGGSTDTMQVGEKRIIPYLKSQGIWRLKCVFISHVDADHISGIIEIMEQMEGIPNRYQGDIIIEQLCLPEPGSQKELYKEILALAEQKKIKVFYFKEGNVWKDEELALNCLSPMKGMEKEDVNRRSMVLYMQYKELDALFTGDIDKEIELSILDKLKKEKILPEHFELLKVSHHGSKFSSDELFLQEIAPEYAVISCGKNNRYGHPHTETMTSLQNLSKQIYNTAETGAVEITCGGEKLKADSYRR